MRNTNQIQINSLPGMDHIFYKFEANLQLPCEVMNTDLTLIWVRGLPSYLASEALADLGPGYQCVCHGPMNKFISVLSGSLTRCNL